jgi:hypothetical protein
MPDSDTGIEDRIQSLEREVSRLKAVTANENSLAFPIAVVIGVIIYIIVITNLPLSNNPGFWARFGIGLASAYAGLGVLSVTLDFVKASLKAIVEVSMVLLALANALTGAFLWAAFRSSDGIPWLRQVTNESFVGMVILAAIVLFIGDALVLLVLYPLARTAGTDLEGNSGADFTDLWRRFRG